MRSPLLVSAALCAAFAIAGCGSSSLLDGSSAEDLQAGLERVRTAVDDGRCDEAQSAATSGLRRVGELPSSVDRKLVARLREGFEDLEQRIPTDCAPRTTTTEPPPATTTDTTTDEEPPPVTTTDEEPPPTTDEEPPSTTTTTPDTTTDDEVPLGDEGSGGTPPVNPDDETDTATPRALRELEGAGRDARKRMQQAGRDARKRMQEASREARKQMQDMLRGMTGAQGTQR